ALFIASHGDNQDKPAARAAHRAYTKLLAHLRSGDAIAAQDFWRKHLDGIEKYMVGDSATTLVEVLS
ncbi:GntR family transcriptional regulator, partial [Rhodococcus hoagii]|nr:GntR family transcriptional regulator [Prescottella equi]